MVAKIKPRAKPHLFMPGQTVTGAIKQHNFYDVTKEEMEGLLAKYKAINGDGNPKPGINVMIPVLPRHLAAAFPS